MKLEAGTTVQFHDALYEARCPKCDSPVEWEADFDADGTNYYARCCKQRLVLRPATVRVEIYEVEES